MSGRPSSLKAVADAVLAGEDFAIAHDEFLDGFYSDMTDPVRLAEAIVDEPAPTGRVDDDVWLAACAEHLATRWGLSTPAWTRGEGRMGGDTRFYPDDPALRAFLLVASPPAFRSRSIFTGPEPLQRARFPYRSGVAECPRWGS